MDFDAKYLQLAAHIGFAASHARRYDEAKTIFEGLHAFRPEQEGPIIGLASVSMARGHHKEAEQMLDKEILSKTPDSLGGRTYKGMSLALQRRPDEAKVILDSVIKDDSNAPEAKLAKGLLEFINTM
ncbi:tetratricopeptide repeat protein [Desulfovibrio inopinatus]|uniref:tetratricopeptide repeat protein n=1 Tax=Desulfovibrio inopinatus TaxID=102109 RepID=UPI00040C6743|nr:tetratricopeptide repeat protein [Desulfovibrio inopinatus]